MTAYRSKPATLVAMKMPDGPVRLTDLLALIEIHFGAVAPALDLEPQFDSEGNKVLALGFRTIQGKWSSATSGEYLAQETDNPKRFYPIEASVFERRWEKTP